MQTELEQQIARAHAVADRLRWESGHDIVMADLFDALAATGLCLAPDVDKTVTNGLPAVENAPETEIDGLFREIRAGIRVGLRTRA